MRKPTGSALGSALFLLFLIFAVGATGQPAGDIERGNELAKEAFKLSRQGDQEAAIMRYRAALEIAPGLHGARFTLARLYASLSRFEEARSEFATLVEANPQDSAARRGEVTALLLLERWQDARKKLEEGLTAMPREGQLAHLLARLLASAPDAAARDGHIALELAVRVYDVQRIPVVAETVAMAFAETGEFDKATRMQRKLVTDAEAAGDEHLLEPMRARLAAYMRQEPWRAASPIEIVQSTEVPEKSQ